MGHRTYLTKITPKKAVTLFEANNFLPFFWLTLIKERDVELVEGEMRKIEALAEEDEEALEKYQDEHPWTSHIKVDKTTAAANMQTATRLIENGFPEAWPLYRDFMQYILQSLADEDYLELDTFSLSAFSGAEDFIEGLKEDLRAIANNEPVKVSGYFTNQATPVTLAGEDRYETRQFANFSSAYKNIQQVQGDAIRAQKQRPEASKPSLAKSLLLTFTAIALLYVPYRGYLKEGWSLTVIFMFAALMGLIYYSATRLWRALKKISSGILYIRTALQCLPMNNRKLYTFLTWLIAIVWLANGLFCKVLRLVPRHQQIVARILGDTYAAPLTIAIGTAETGMAIWIISGVWQRLNVVTQIAVIAAMNLLEFLLVPDLLLWGRFNALFAFLFILLIWYNGFILYPKKTQTA